jgi:hypothetical protein
MNLLDSCLRHRDAYATRAQAQAALAAWRSRARERGEKITGRPEPFRCKVCRKWHLGRAASAGQRRGSR